MTAPTIARKFPALPQVTCGSLDVIFARSRDGKPNPRAVMYLHDLSHQWWTSDALRGFAAVLQSVAADLDEHAASKPTPGGGTRVAKYTVKTGA